MTTRENADTPVITTPLRACPGVLGGSQWNGPAFNPGTNLLYVPAVDWCATFSSFEQVRYIPGKLYMGGKTDLDPVDKSQGWLTAVDASTGAREMEVPLAAPDGGGGDDHRRQRRDDRRADRRLPRLRRALPATCSTASTPAARSAAASITYAVGGKQYVAVASGSPSNFWVERNPGSPTIVVFALPGAAGR